MTTADVERTLAAWLEEVEPHGLPSDLLTRTFSVTRGTSPRRPLIARFSIATADARILPRLDVSPAVGMAVVLLLLALLIGAFIVGSRLFTLSSGWRHLEDASVDGVTTWVSDVAAVGPGLVVIGNTVEEIEGGCGRQLDGRIWTSPDGAAWTDRGREIFADVRLEKLVPAGDRVYALGTTDAACGTGAQPINQSWSSTDAVTWSSVAGASDMDGSFLSVAVDAGGVPIVFGAYQQPMPPDGTGASETRVWTATQTGWIRIATLDNPYVAQAAAIDNVVLASAVDFEGRSRILRSVDGGRTWVEMAVEADDVMALSAADGRFALFGARRSDDGSAVPVLLVSEDEGISWSEGPTPPFFVVEAWSVGGRVIAAGQGEPIGEPECVESSSAPIGTAYRSLEPGETAEPTGTKEAHPSESFCIRFREPGWQTWQSDDGVVWHEGAGLPDRGRELPEITVPIPNSSYRLIGRSDVFVITNPTFGDMVWLSRADEFAAADEED